MIVLLGEWSHACVRIETDDVVLVVDPGTRGSQVFDAVLVLLARMSIGAHGDTPARRTDR